MLKTFYSSLMMTLVLAVILCGAYPFAVTVVGKILFKDKANGSFISVGGRVVGSKLIGQAFSKPEYFHPRPSSAGTGYDAANSSGSNLGPTNSKLEDAVKANVDAVLKENPALKFGHIPVDMVTASGSGLDPHISPENAYAQADRVALARKMNIGEMKKIIENHIESPQWGIFGEPVVNVLVLNMDLDQRK